MKILREKTFGAIKRAKKAIEEGAAREEATKRL